MDEFRYPSIPVLPDHRIVLVVGVVGVSQFSVRPELKLEELVAELALVADVVAEVEVVTHLEQVSVFFRPEQINV